MNLILTNSHLKGSMKLRMNLNFFPWTSVPSRAWPLLVQQSLTLFLTPSPTLLHCLPPVSQDPYFQGFLCPTNVSRPVPLSTRATSLFKCLFFREEVSGRPLWNSHLPVQTVIPPCLTRLPWLTSPFFYWTLFVYFLALCCFSPLPASKLLRAGVLHSMFTTLSSPLNSVWHLAGTHQILLNEKWTRWAGRDRMMAWILQNMCSLSLAADSTHAHILKPTSFVLPPPGHRGHASSAQIYPSDLISSLSPAGLSSDPHSSPPHLSLFLWPLRAFIQGQTPARNPPPPRTDPSLVPPWLRHLCYWAWHFVIQSFFFIHILFWTGS